MKIQSLLEEKIQSALQPELLRVFNESPKHSVPEGSESHFSVLIVSEKFTGLPLIKRHQMVHKLVGSEIKEKIHAFSQTTLTPEEYTERGGQLPASPPCAKKS